MHNQEQQYQNKQKIQNQTFIKASIQNNSFSQMLYTSRLANDKLLINIIQKTIQNDKLTQQLYRLKSRAPSILTKWCSKNDGIKVLTSFTQQFSQALNSQTTIMTERLDLFKKQKQMLTVQHQKQADQYTQLTQRIKNLQIQLKTITNQNDQYEKQLRQLYKQQKTFLQQLKQRQKRKHFFKLQKTILQDQQQCIKAATKLNNYQDAQYQYYSKLTSLIDHINQRQRQVTDKKSLMSQQISRLDKLIQELKQEKEGAQRKRTEIVNKHRELLSLKIDLARVKEKRAEALKQKNTLQQRYCENYMTEVVDCYHELDQKYTRLAQKVMDLALVAGATLDIESITRKMNQIPIQ